MTLSEFKDSCSEHMFYCYGTSALFQKRERWLKRAREWITYLGIIGPLVIGSAVGAFGIDWKVNSISVFPLLITIASIVGIVQIVLSCWALVARWDEAYGGAQESIRANNSLYNRFKQLRDIPPVDFQSELQDALDEYGRQEGLDTRQSISEKEKRYAYHEAMRYLSKPCVTCANIPNGKPTKCPRCGYW